MAQAARTISADLFDNIDNSKTQKIEQFFQPVPKTERPSVVTIGKSIDDVFRFFRDFSNIPLFVKEIKRVELLTPLVSRWTFEKEGEKETWETEIVKDEFCNLIEWKVIGESEFGHSAIATFRKATADLGTVVTLKFSDDRKHGKLSSVISYFLGKEPKPQSYIILRNLKALLETGEVPTIEGQPNGKNFPEIKTKESEAFL